MNVTRTALLIDGDNISARYDQTLKLEAEKLGRLDVVRVYGCPSVSAEWPSTPGARFMQAGTGKNAADLLLSIDAMELALSDGITAFAIASSDGDFTHLAHRLREKGNFVLGLGDARAPEHFRMACHAFHLLQDQNDAVPTDFDRNIQHIIMNNSKNDQGIALTELLRQMRRHHDTKISTYPGGSWRRYLGERPTLYALDPKGPAAKVRCLPKGFAGNCEVI